MFIIFPLLLAPNSSLSIALPSSLINLYLATNLSLPEEQAGSTLDTSEQ
jgi:hypothetical protein